MEVPTLASFQLGAVAPTLFLAVWTVVLLVADLFIPKDRKQLTAGLAIMGLVGALLFLAVQATDYDQTVYAFQGMLIVDGYTLFLEGIILVASLIGVLLAMDYIERRNISQGEYYPLLLFSVLGVMLMAMAADMIVIFVSLELMSIPLYILTGFARPDPLSEEAAMKYFILGAFASAFLVYGIALIYGGTGTTSLVGMMEALRADPLHLPPLVLIGSALILVGLASKVGAVPFHMWTPDAYHGAPTSVTAYMAVGAKVGAFAAILRILFIAMPPAVSAQWENVLAVIAALTMILGNVVAISQTNVKRMLAYSSIAHAGYILLAISSAQDPATASEAGAAVVFYLLTYTFTTMGAFAALMAVEDDRGKNLEFKYFEGMSRHYPLFAIAVTLLMFSLIGMPPSAGMVGKWFVFRAAVRGASGNPIVLTATIIGVITSVISAFYYLRLPLLMYMKEGENKAVFQPGLKIVLVVTVVMVLLLGVLPGPLYELARMAFLSM